MKAYLLLFNYFHADNRQKIQDALEKIPEVTYWYSCFPECVFFTSHLTAQQLFERIETLVPRNPKVAARFLVLECGPDRQGWLPPAAWHLMNNPDNPRIPEKK